MVIRGRRWAEAYDAWQGEKDNIIKYQRQKREMEGFEKG